MFTFTVFTLIDITKTGVITADTKFRNQQRNWETLIQVLGLRTQVTLLSAPAIIEENLLNHKFGSKFTGKQLIWKFKFSIEQDAIYANDIDEFGTLKSDLTHVPVTVGLSETVNIITPTFCTIGDNCNIYFESII